MSLAKIRSYRIFGLAIFDLVSALLGTILIVLWAKKKHFPDLPVQPFLWTALIVTIPLGVVTHILFGTNTTLNYRLGVSRRP